MAEKGRDKTERMRSGDEYDALTKSRKYHPCLDHPGIVAKIKRAFNKRVRRITKQNVREELKETD